MGTTTMNCPQCNDRGVIHVELFPGVWSFGQCNCRPPEYWTEQSNQLMAELSQRIDKVNQVGCEYGQTYTRGQEC